MALPWDPTTGNAVPGVSGVLQNPIQNPLADLNAAGIRAQAEQRAKLNALQKQLYLAQVLREQPGGGFAQGPGPLGARQGVGPMGWAVTLGDLVAGLITRGKQKKSAEGVTEASQAESEANQRLMEEIQKRPGNFVPQGSPLSLGNY